MKNFSVLNDLIDNPDITNIRVLSPSRILIKTDGEWEDSTVHFEDGSDYLNLVDSLLSENNYTSDIVQVIFTDMNFNEKYGLKHVINNMSEMPNLHIRKLPKYCYESQENSVPESA